MVDFVVSFLGSKNFRNGTVEGFFESVDIAEVDVFEVGGGNGTHKSTMRINDSNGRDAFVPDGFKCQFEWRIGGNGVDFLADPSFKVANLFVERSSGNMIFEHVLKPLCQGGLGDKSNQRNGIFEGFRNSSDENSVNVAQR